MNLQSLAIIYPHSVYIFGILFSLITQNSIGIYFTFLTFFLGGFMNFVFKCLATVIAKFTNNQWLIKQFQRPNPPEYGCGVYPLKKNMNSKECNKFIQCILNFTQPKLFGKLTGMPSGHAQIAAITSMFWSLYILDNYPNNIYKQLSIIVLWIITIYVGYSRIKLGCHNLLQVSIGVILGSIIGYWIYYFINQEENNFYYNQ